MSESPVQFDTELLDGVWSDYFNESGEVILALNEYLLELNESLQSPDESAVAAADTQRMNELSRAAHNLKGLSSMLGLNDISRLTHRVEDVLEAARHSNQVADCDEVQSALATLDRISAMIDALQTSDEYAGKIDESLQGNGPRRPCENRVVPLERCFAQFAHVIRDVSAQCGKRIRTIAIGQQLQVEKHIVDYLGDPLLHIARNAVDHGIESPPERIAAGKYTVGEIRLDASRNDKWITLTISDDGRGLNPQEIVAMAIQLGVIDSSDAVRMDRREIYQLIFAPGFSTAQRVTEISGRGIGMDIVKSKIAAIDGHIEIDSTPGAGTSITIKLPACP